MSSTTAADGMEGISNSDFDINILQDPLIDPVVDMKFPLPIDKETYIDSPNNVKTLHQSFNLLHSAYRFFTGAQYYDKIYKDVEYKYFMNKHDESFKKKFKDHMDGKLEKDDPKLDEIVYNLINQELNMKLIKASEFKARFKEVKDYMIKYYKAQNEINLPTFASHQFIRSAYVTVMTIMQKLFPKGIWVSNQEMSNLFQKYIQNPMSIIWSPSHQSHLDYVIIHLMSIRFNIATPSVIAGENLNVAIVGNLLKKLGAIFIPRSFNNELYTERNLNNVMEFLLVNNTPFEVFIEGTRSRDGKLLLPKYGILKSLVSIYLKQRNEDHNASFDMLFQPLGVTYERIYENDSFLKELRGDDKTQESLFGIVSVATSAFFPKKDQLIHDKDGYYDNSTRNLTGKIFVKLGQSFTLSEFLASEQQQHRDVEIKSEKDVNLKKLGFKILHEVNRIAFIPEISIIGTALQAYTDYSGKTLFTTSEMIPTMRLVLKLLFRENESSVTNKIILKDMLDASDDELESVIKYCIASFFRFIKVNEKKNLIKIESPIELLYYKNLTIHLIIHKCIAMYLLMLLDGEYSANRRILGKLFYVVTSLLKNEFLFDYDENPRNNLNFILDDLVEQGIISRVEPRKAIANSDTSSASFASSTTSSSSSSSSSATLVSDSEDDVPDLPYYKIEDRQYVKTFANLAQPFIESYIVLITNILEMTTNLANNYARAKRQQTHAKIILDDEDLKYPTTKGLLKYIIDQSKKKARFKSLESINKQYLVSDLYYLNNLQLVKIFKNKAKTKAFVQILNPKDLDILNQFLMQLLNLSHGEKSLLVDDVNISYIIDIVDKNFDRDSQQIRRYRQGFKL
ncbi:hypothetical protein KGF57_004087 [Candida theae]|uniref:Phospholipid/glycerol acyltransferase domain-containing protein n=1 Tax=Candida theae TaxID=1198502 RepID=A0AAD5BBW8_9ASCO|nr:uncharacterized protein KGF57_004087 [Candida theae]KAI5952991.1 hypothetical protein KGF57_004087 [Candida theae]